MPAIDIRVLDVSGSRACAVEAPDDVAINRILVLLVEKMNLPLNSPDGQIMSYKLHHRRSGSQLLENLTLAEELEYYGTLYGLDRATVRRRSSPLIERLGLADRTGHLLKTFSRGMRRKFHLIRALLHEPRHHREQSAADSEERNRGKG